MEELGRSVPVHYQEPFRRGYAKWQPAAEDFAADLKAARAGGAAGWCFHNGGTRGEKDGRPRRSFDLRDGSLFDQLDTEERKFVEQSIDSEIARYYGVKEPIVGTKLQIQHRAVAGIAGNANRACFTRPCA